MLFGFFVAACDMGAFPQRFAATIAGAAKGWQMGVWPNIAPAWLCLSSDTDPDKGDGLRGIPPSRRQKTSASGAGSCGRPIPILLVFATYSAASFGITGTP